MQYVKKGFKEVMFYFIAGIKKAPIGAFSFGDSLFYSTNKKRVLKSKTYFLESAPKRLLNLSTRPPVSAAFCLPV